MWRLAASALNTAALVALLTLALPSTPLQAAQSRSFVDSAGRQTVLPAVVDRVFAAGPPASVFIYTLAPDKLLGWTRALRPEDKALMPPRYAALPVTGRLTGQAPTDLAAVVALQPDVIIDIGTVDPAYAALANRVQQQTGIPYVLLDGSLARTADTYRVLGDLLGEPGRAETLAAYAEQTLHEIASQVAAVPTAGRLRLYYGGGPDGLETAAPGSINAEIIDAVGAVNVPTAAGSGHAAVSLEQILSWDPAVVVALDAGFGRVIAADPRWQGVAAVRSGRILLAPGAPFGWVDSPPGPNRLLGLRWLASSLYPDVFAEDLRETTRAFYALFYRFTPSQDQVEALLAGAGGG